MLKKLIIQITITSVSLLVVLVMFEYYLRETTTHIIRQDLKNSGGVLDATPEFLIDNSSGKRRFVPGARVLIKNHYFSGLDIEMKINSLGFRDDEIKKKKAPNEFRILGLGDSITVQDYLSFDDTYLHQLETSLNRSGNFQVINTAIGNIGLQEEIEILKEKGIKLNPDLVLVGLYLNDTRPPWGFSGEIGDRGWLRKKSLLVETVLRNFEEKKWADEKDLIRFGWIKKRDELKWKENPKDFLKLVDAAQFDWGHAWQQEAWDILAEKLQDLKTLSQKHNFRVAIVYFPVTFQIDAQTLQNVPQQNARKIALENGFEFLDLLPALRGKNSATMYYDHCHPNAHGSKIIAEEIEKFLQEKKLLVASQ